MTNQPSDPKLKALFQELRAADEERAPGFRELWAGLQEQTVERPLAPETEKRAMGRFPRRLAWGGSLLAAAAAGAALFLLSTRGASETDFVNAVRAFSTSPAGGAWRSPTDGLLSLPGAEVLRTRPKLGDRPWPTTTGVTPRTTQS